MVFFFCVSRKGKRLEDKVVESRERSPSREQSAIKDSIASGCTVIGQLDSAPIRLWRTRSPGFGPVTSLLLLVERRKGQRIET